MGQNGRSFAIEQINMADQETALVIGEGFHQIIADALLAYKQPEDDQPNPALASLGLFIRDCGYVLRGQPMDPKRFPMLCRINEELDGDLVEMESNYED